MFQIYSERLRNASLKINTARTEKLYDAALAGNARWQSILSVLWERSKTERTGLLVVRQVLKYTVYHSEMDIITKILLYLDPEARVENYDFEVYLNSRTPNTAPPFTASPPPQYRRPFSSPKKVLIQKLSFYVVITKPRAFEN